MPLYCHCAGSEAIFVGSIVPSVSEGCGALVQTILFSIVLHSGSTGLLSVATMEPTKASLEINSIIDSCLSDWKKIL